MRNSKVSILHSTRDWLALTKSWIFDQIRFMPDEVKQSVWCDTLIPGPHNEWKADVFVGRPRKLSDRLIGRMNRAFGRVIVRPRAPMDFSQYDVLFSHFGPRAWQDHPYVHGLRIKKAVRFYGGDVGVTPKQSGWLDKYRNIFEEYNILICEGPHMAKELEQLGAPKDKIHWVHLGIDPKLIIHKRQLTPTELLTDPVSILVAGTFTEKKGIEYALDGVLRFAKETCRAIRFTLIGDSNDSMLKESCRKEEIEQLFAMIQQQTNIEASRRGYVPLEELHTIMKEHLIFISPSVKARNGDIEGGFPVTLTHAAANGMILIGTNHCDLPEIVRQDVNGYICQERSALEIASCLKGLANTQIQRLSQMRWASIDLVSGQFDAVQTSRRLMNLLAGDASAR